MEQARTLKKKQTFIKKYGVENPFAADEVKEKIKNTLTDKYGVDNVSKSDVNKQKIKAKWETKTPDELQQILDKRAQTNSEKYGCLNAASAPATKEKTKQTCERKYGVPYFCMTEACKKYSSNNSAPNRLFEKLLLDNNIPFEREFNIEHKSYDFKLTDNNTLIEVNPTATHNSTWGIFGKAGLDSDYHFNKTKLAKLNGFRCINLFDWDNLDKILMLLTRKEKLYARNCTAKEITLKESNDFLNEYHLQNGCKSTAQIGLFNNNNLVAVMTFGKPRYNKNFEYELLRYASSQNIIGGANKLFNYFIKTYSVKSTISYCDFSKFTGNVYTKLNFKYEGCTIGKHWYNPKTRVHITDNLLRQQGFDRLLGKEYGTFGKGSSNEELMKQFGFIEVYDAGQGKYTFYK